MTLSTSGARQRSVRGFRARTRQGPARAQRSEHGRPHPSAPLREAPPEDDGLTYAYEKVAFARIPILWNDGARTLSIGKRQGSFPGMLNERTFQVVLVAKGKPVGFSFEPKVDATAKYVGEPVTVKL
jgi:hypothetical protein